MIPVTIIILVIQHKTSIYTRWLWNVSCLAQLLDSLHDVHLLWNGSSGTCLPQVSLVEEIHDIHADC